MAFSTLTAYKNMSDIIKVPTIKMKRNLKRPLSWDTWKKINEWHLVMPPSRPSVYHLGIFENALKNASKDLPVAVLGCTPELRDILFELGFKNIYIFDKSHAVYSRMDRLRVWSNKEQFIWGNWLETIPRFKDFFGVILSDLTSGNIPYDWQPAFYSSISTALTTDGIFIDKILTHSGPKRKVTDLMEKYSNLPFNLLYVNYFSCEFLFCSELLDIKQVMDSSLFYDLLKKKFKQGPLTKFLSESPRITPRDTFWYYGKDWQEISQWYFRYIKSVKIFEEEDSSPYCGNLKIIIGSKSS